MLKKTKVTFSRSYFEAVYKSLDRESYQKSEFDTQAMMPHLWDPESPQFSKKLHRDMKVRGWTVIDFNSCSLNESDRNDWLKENWGELWNEQGILKGKALPIRAEKSGRYFANLNIAQPLHTDEGHEAVFPNVIALHCLKSAQNGGLSVLVRVQDVFDDLKMKFGTRVYDLFDPCAVTIENVHQKIQKPVFFYDQNEVALSFSSTLQSLECSFECAPMIERLIEFIHEPQHQNRFLLLENQMLILNNHRHLHGRTAFEEGSSRHLLRYWMGRRS